MPLGTNLPEALTPLFAVITLPAGILAGLFVGLEAAAVVLVVGWLVLVPASAILFGPGSPVGLPTDDLEEAIELAERAKTLGATGGTGDEEDPLQQLRERYAQGEIDEAELERRLEALLELEDLAADDEAAIERAIERVGTSDVPADSGIEVERE